MEPVSANHQLTAHDSRQVKRLNRLSAYIGEEIDGKVEVKYQVNGVTITRDLDEWLAGKPGASE